MTPALIELLLQLVLGPFFSILSLLQLVFGAGGASG